MARSPGRKKPTRSVSSHRDAQMLIGMHGRKRSYRIRVNALHGVEHAHTIYRLLKRREREMGWLVRAIDKLELLVRVHQHINVASRALDDLASALAPAPPPSPARATAATASTSASSTSPPTASSATVGHRPRLHLPDSTLRHAARLLDAGTAPPPTSARATAATASTSPATASSGSRRPHLHLPDSTLRHVARLLDAGTAPPPTSARATAATASTPASSTSPSTASSTTVGRRPRLRLPDATLPHAARMLEAGTTLRSQRLGGAVQRVVHGLGLLLEGLAVAILMDRPVPAVLFAPVANQQPELPFAPPSPPPAEMDIRDLIGQAKTKLLLVWKLRISAADFKVISA